MNSNNPSRRDFAGAAGLAALLYSTGALAQSTPPASGKWPSKTVRVVVPAAPGGGTDTFGRILAQGLSERLNANFVIDNKPGAAGSLGSDFVAKSAGDGYTVLISSNSSIGINPALIKTLPFDAEKDFTPVARGVTVPLSLVTHKSSPYKSVQELVAFGKQNPKALSYGSPGAGSAPYLAVRILEEASGAKFTHVPYKGVAPAFQDLLGERLDFMFPDLSSCVTYIESGRMKALLVNESTPALPGVPTFKEAGLGQVTIDSSFSVMLPAGVAPAIVDALATAIAQVMRDPKVAAQLARSAYQPVFDDPQSFAQDLRRERRQWRALADRLNIVMTE